MITLKFKKWFRTFPILGLGIFSVSCLPQGTGKSVAQNVALESVEDMPSRTAPAIWDSIRHVVVIILENTDYSASSELPFFKTLAQRGAKLSQFFATTHPSQPNYIALVAGHPYTTSNDPITLDVKHIGDLMESQQLSWKLYAEGFPGDCSLTSTSGSYARRHVPFLSFKNVTQNSDRCRRIVSAADFDRDDQSNQLPHLSYYIPNNNNNGHDTGPGYADQWLKNRFGKTLDPSDPDFRTDTLYVITYDEGSYLSNNQINTLLIGSAIQPGSQSKRRYNHYSLLASIEKIFKLPSLGQKDQGAAILNDPAIWKTNLD